MAERTDRAGALCLTLLVLAGLLAAQGLAEQVPPRLWPALAWPDPASMAQVVAAYSVLPRLAAALLAGAALGLAGALLQQALRNPLASPGTLGISAGAHLSLAAASLYAPGLLVAVGRDAVAFLGGAGTMALALALTWRGGLAPAAVALAGLAVGLYAGAVGAVLALLHTRQLAGLFVWGSGSLAQLGWAVPGQLLLRLTLAAAAAWLLARPLRLLDLPDEAAQGLGVPVPLIRLAALAAAAALGGSVVSLVGVIGFVGLAAPMLVRLAGAGQRSTAWAPVMGAALLAVTDQLVQRISGLSATLVPTGAVTALLGAPLLLWLLTRVSSGRAAPALAAETVRRAPRAAPVLLLGTLVLLGLVGLALALGNSLSGWTWGTAMLPLRVPRVAAAATAGAMLAVAGAVLQRMLGNPLASPEVLGLSTGTMLGLVAALWLGADGVAARLLAGAAGAAGVLAILLAYARGGGAPERMLLAGIALGTSFEGVLALLLASGDPRAETVLAWLSGSTYAVDAGLAWTAAGMMLALLALAALAARWLELLPLGDGVAAALGLGPRRARAVLLLLVAGLTGTATLLVGPLSFVGLMAPHLARLLGLPRAGTGMAGAALCGAVVMVAADWLGRTVLFPAEIPAGLVAALLGGPALLWGLARRPA